jgi:outer membrane protein OmpA-like peptidoglycan-associated protein
MLSPSRIRSFTLSLCILILVSCGPRERAAREEVGDEPIEVEEVTEEPETIVIEDMDFGEPGELRQDLELETIHFDLNRFDIRSEDASILKGNADMLQRYPDSRVLIEGHCCPLGTNEYNMALGWKRANATKDYLERLGIASGRMTTTSFGEERVIDSEPERFGRNRRCEFKVMQ